MKKINAYKTSNGKVFENLEDATVNEIEEKLKAFVDSTPCSYSESEILKAFLVDYKCTLTEILNFKFEL